ncbi:MAG: hypothetical protein IJP17_06160, partial [Clostridia bacterium]|nr:hypothetical protein [Clostridia bacterium]
FHAIIFTLGHRDDDIINTIKKRLKYYRLGPFDAEKHEYAKKLLAELEKDICEANPLYYRPEAAKKAKCTTWDAFDAEAMGKDYILKYDKLTKAELSNAILSSIYYYYMR